MIVNVIFALDMFLGAGSFKLLMLMTTAHRLRDLKMLLDVFKWNICTAIFYTPKLDCNLTVILSYLKHT